MSSSSVGVVVLTLNGAHHLPYCLPPLLSSSLKPRVLVVDSSSDDSSEAVAHNLGAEVLVIPRGSFNHGSTREMARKRLCTDFVVMVTQDAYADEDALENLVAPLREGKAAVAYGRQLPRQEANIFERFHRHFNYPAESHLRSLADISRYGKYTFFCSNSFAAYSHTALDAIGGFDSVLFGEDTVAVAKLLRQGHSIAYVAEAFVYHSHDYSLLQEFQRHFDIGYSRRQNASLLHTSDSDSVRGRAYALSLLRHLAAQAPHKLPYALMLLGSKWIGYQLGWRGSLFPSQVKRFLSSQKKAWSS